MRHFFVYWTPASLTVFAYNRRTGRPVWQSGVVQAELVPVQAAVLSPYPLPGAILALEPVKAAPPPATAAPSVESTAAGPPNPKPPAQAGATTPPLSMEPILLPIWLLNPAGKATSPASK
jgi:hypothetical protein